MKDPGSRLHHRQRIINRPPSAGRPEDATHGRTPGTESPPPWRTSWRHARAYLKTGGVLPWIQSAIPHHPADSSLVAHPHSAPTRLTPGAHHVEVQARPMLGGEATLKRHTMHPAPRRCRNRTVDPANSCLKPPLFRSHAAPPVHPAAGIPMRTQFARTVTAFQPTRHPARRASPAYLFQRHHSRST